MFLITLLTKCMEQFFDLYQNKDLTFFLHRISYTIYGYIWPDSTTVWFKKSEFCIFDSFFEFPIQFWPRKMVWHSMISSSEKWHIRYLVKQNCPWRLEMCLNLFPFSWFSRIKFKNLLNKYEKQAFRRHSYQDISTTDQAFLIP